MDLEELQLQLELELSSDIDFEKGESDFDDEDSGQRFIPAAPEGEIIVKEASLSEEDESWLRFLRSVEDRRPSSTALKDLESEVHSKTSLEQVEDFQDSPISEDLQAQPPRFYHSPAVELEVREAMEGILTTLDFVHQLSLPSLDDEILPCLLPLCGPIDLLSCPTPYALYVGVGIKSFTEEDEEMISNAIASPQFDITTISSHENEAFHKPTASSFNNFNENDSSFSLILPVPAPIIILDNEATLETDRARRAERKTRRTQLAEREHQRLRLQKATVVDLLLILYKFTSLSNCRIN